MAPRKRRQSAGMEIQAEPVQVKRVTTTDREKLICKKKLDALDKEESLANEDRFTTLERRRLLDAYNENGFHVFHDTKLLHKYLPNRRESDLMVLVNRLRSSLSSATNDGTALEEQRSQPLEDWQKLCNQLMSSFAKDKKINFDDILSEALLATAETMELEAACREPSKTVEGEQSTSNDPRPNYPKLMRSFAQVLMGLFPESMDPITSQLSIRLYQHINSVVDSFDLNTALPQLLDGTWLELNAQERRLQQEMASTGLAELNKLPRKCPTFRDLENNRNIEALCLELPKIKRITDVLNPLHINESLVSTLME